MEEITIEKYDESKYDHRYVSIILDNDADFHRYVGDTYFLIKNMQEKQERGFADQIYIAYANEQAIGLVELRILEGHPYISIGIIPEKRGHHYGRKLFLFFIEYLFLIHQEFENIYASVNPQNIASIKSVLSVGFARVNHTKYVKKRD